MKKHIFVCSLCRNGILGGVLYLDAEALTYRTNKLSIDPKYRNLVLPLSDIAEITWKRLLFPVASIRMNNGEKHTLLIFNKARFCRHYQAYTA